MNGINHPLEFFFLLKGSWGMISGLKSGATHIKEQPENGEMACVGHACCCRRKLPVARAPFGPYIHCLFESRGIY